MNDNHTIKSNFETRPGSNSQMVFSNLRTTTDFLRYQSDCNLILKCLLFLAFILFIFKVICYIKLIIISVMQQVNFSELTEVKKRQFFQYLNKHNIQFKEGPSNYYAKVILKPDPVNPNIKPSSYNQISKLKFPIKEKGKENRQSKLFVQRQKDVQPKKSAIQRLSTPKKSHSPLINRRKQQLSLSDYSLQTPLNLSDIIAKTQKSTRCKTQRNQKSVDKVGNQNSHKKLKYPLKKREALPVPRFGDSKQRESKLLNKSFQQRIQEKLLPYLRIFKINSIVCRPTKWSKHQLQKCIQQIYSACFTKNNTIINKVNKYKQTLEKDYVFVSFISEFYENKFKTKKSIQSNIVALLHSLIHHLEQDRSKNIVIFNMFLLEQYHYEDLTFFLFVRNLAEKQFKKSNEKVDKSKFYEDDFKFYMTQKEVIKLIRTLVGRDAELLEQYSSLISSNVTNKTTSMYQVLQILVDHFHRKRQNSSTANRQSVSSKSIIPYQRNQSNFLSKPKQEQTTQHHMQSQTQQLTFGQSTLRSREYDDTFWYQTNQKSEIPTDSLQLVIVQKMDTKISDLIKHILQDDEQFRYTISQFHGLIFNKARNLIRAVFDMDKMKWFKLLNIRDPSVTHLQHVQKLQKMIRLLRNQSGQHSINKFCIKLLTTHQFLDAIEKIVIG